MTSRRQLQPEIVLLGACGVADLTDEQLRNGFRMINQQLGHILVSNTAVTDDKVLAPLVNASDEFGRELARRANG